MFPSSKNISKVGIIWTAFMKGLHNKYQIWIEVAPSHENIHIWWPSPLITNAPCSNHSILIVITNHAFAKSYAWCLSIGVDASIYYNLCFYNLITSAMLCWRQGSGTFHSAGKQYRLCTRKSDKNSKNCPEFFISW